MSLKAFKVLGVAGAVVAAAAALVAVVSGGCTSCIETVSGACVPMKCHWAMIAVALIEVIAASDFLGLAFVKCKIGRRWLAAACALCQVLAVACLYGLIGLCGAVEMHCHATALAVSILAAISVVLCIVAAAKADPNAANMPKRGL